MAEKSDNQYDGLNYIPIPEAAIKQTLDTIFIDTAYAIIPTSKYVFEVDDAIWYDESTGRLYADGKATLVAAGSGELDDDMLEIFFAKVWQTDNDGNTGQYYIDDLRKMNGAIPRHDADVTEMPKDQESLSAWEEYHQSKRMISAALISTEGGLAVEKVGDTRLFEQLDRLAQQVDEANELADTELDETEQSAEEPDAGDSKRRRIKLGQKVRSLLGRQR